jgi:hypothetical protein
VTSVTGFLAGAAIFHSPCSLVDATAKVKMGNRNHGPAPWGAARHVRLLVLLAPFFRGAASAEQLGDVDFPLAVDPSGRRLQDVVERPFLVNGDAAWSLMVELTKPEVEAYFEDRREKGFNTVLVNLIERGFGGPANREGALPFVPSNDFTAPNEAYFAHADWVIDTAAANDILVLLTPAYLGFDCGDQGWCQQMLAQPLSAMTAYGQYLGERYKDRRNVLWVHGGDVDASEYSGALSRVNAIAAGILERAPLDQLHTGHCSRQNSAIDCYDQPWLDVNNTYSDCSSSLSRVRADYAESPIQSFFYIEGDYENEGPSLGCLIDQHAWAVLGGGSGHVFGNNPIWFFGGGWKDELSEPGSLAMAHLGDLFLSRAWFRLQPDTSAQLLTSGGGSGAAAAITGDGESLLAYVPTARSITVDAGDLASGSVHAWYFDPSSGAVTDLGLRSTAAPLGFSVPGRRVLVLDTEESQLPAPGSARYQYIPEPSVNLMLGSGIALLGAMERRRAAAGRGVVAA